ncbi:MAG: 30S ribosomal protein S16 [Candidatus Edwardsbacteria bacterium]|nr:30S ribosomal protein S16 [Candidatus Edwardsbacteria bacterium]
MSVSIRMSRIGANKKASFRIVASATRSKCGGAQLDTLGFYRPGGNPREAKINLERTREWIKNGAIVSTTVQRIVKAAEESVKNGGDAKDVRIAFDTTKTKKTHKERLAAKKKKKD